ncbi:hypothetical protein O6H91_23G043900 [Diphasiastrum complanatum]|uniref:Uncharacterized protein n=2 Tax=Diphasiastrum complanatum TaxID=34168 RepID=A0ACC2AA67_DIPCM|nr:hypothetical protein O6H91_23G043600 [Diphasiastrum complanatum]KAJ7514437.1 hypothetical protein O6H91_23G043900 [Diphasiastrum complanatum]
MGDIRVIQSNGNFISEKTSTSIEIARAKFRKSSVARFVGDNELKVKGSRLYISTNVSVKGTKVCAGGSQIGRRYLLTHVQHTISFNKFPWLGKDTNDGSLQRKGPIASTSVSEDNASQTEDQIRILNRSHSESGDANMLPNRRQTRRVGAESTRKSEPNVRTEESTEEGCWPNRAKSGSWACTAGAREPLSKEEEVFFYTSVQDLIYLDSKKDELEKKLGRNVNTEEWAEHVGISIFRLYARIGHGRAAKRKMIAANLPLVDSVARKYHGKGLSHWELCQEGVWGLLKSAEKYDVSFKAKFSTYAFFWIQEKISSAARKFGRVLSVGRSLQRNAARILKHKEIFEEVNDREPTLDELALCSRMKKDRIHKVFNALRPSKSLKHTSSSTNSKRTCMEFADVNSGYLQWQALRDEELKKEVGKAMHTLSPRERQVLELRYGLNGHLPQRRAQVALMMDLHYETTRMAEVALEKLRKFDLHHYFTEDIWR